MSFVHLRLHTQFSLLEGALRLPELFERVKAQGMPAVAITDTNNLFGAIEFVNAAKKAGVKPILGIEISYAPGGKNALVAPATMGTQAPSAWQPKVFKLVLLAKSFRGYQNLCQLATRAYTEAPVPTKGQPQAPKAVIDWPLLNQYGDDLIVLSGCIRGEIPYLLLSGDESGAQEAARRFHQRFKDDFYFELTDSGLSEQERANIQLFQLGEQMGVKCVATANVHYLDPKTAEAHEVLQCIESGRNLDFDRPKSLVPSEYWLKPAELMQERFAQFAGACENTVEVAAKCEVKFPFNDEKGRTIYRLPNFRPEGVSKTDDFDPLAYFRDQSRKGLEERFKEPSFQKTFTSPDWSNADSINSERAYRERLETELVMIERTGFAGYFLIVADFIGWAKDHDIPVGPGRGSGAGSIVAWALRITDIDPIRFQLLFERFINPERISMPDFDIDFCQDRRGEVIDYVVQKYGKDNVCQIITFGKLQARAALKDVGRVFGLTFAETDALTKLMPEELGITIADAIDKEPRFREKIEQEPRMGKVVEYALALEGLYRNAGVHAAGVIITEEPVVTYCPLFLGREQDLVCQFDKDSAEKIGLVKYDFLGLKTLTVIDQAVKLVRKTADPGTDAAEFTLAKMPYDDAAVFALISSGDTDGIFQVESSGMKDLCSRMQPSVIDDLTAICALYRPGPLQSGMVDDYIDRKHGRAPVSYDVPALENILRETYGVILYQEQVMQIAREIAGYSLGQADLLRRAMGKKKPEEMAEHRGIFVKGATDLGLEAKKAESLFDLMAMFAEYGFNKSHSAAYGVLTYQTAYLKTHHPAEFMAALMTTEMDSTDKLTKYIGNCRANKIEVLPPDVNRSQRKFSVERLKDGTRAVRFGLEAIKGVGGSAVESILEARAEGGDFDGLLGFCRRVPTRKTNKKVLESLILSGAFDSIAEVNRPSMLASLESVMEVGSDEQEERALGQSSLFDSFGADEIKLITPTSAVFKQEEDWPRARKLIQEKQVVGFYVSGHPMDHWQKITDDWLGWNTEKIRLLAEQKAEQRAAGKKDEPASQPQGGWGGQGGGGGRYSRPQRPEVKLALLITEMREVMTKKGTRMAFGQVEDLYGRMEVVFFPDAYAQVQEILRKAMGEAEPLLLTAELELAEEGPKLLAKSVEWVADAHKNRVQQIVLKLNPETATADQLRALKRCLIEHRGKCPLRIEFRDPRFRTQLQVPNSIGVSPTPQMVAAVNRIFGTDVVSLQ